MRLSHLVRHALFLLLALSGAQPVPGHPDDHVAAYYAGRYALSFYQGRDLLTGGYLPKVERPRVLCNMGWCLEHLTDHERAIHAQLLEQE